MSNICAGPVCPIILDSTCVFYSGANLIYTGINTNDSLQVALTKINNKFRDAGIGYAFQNGIIQSAPGQPVKLGGSLIENTTITSNSFNLTVTGNLVAGAHVTSGGTSSQFVKGDGSLDNGPYQPGGNYITDLTGDGTASGPGSAAFTLDPVSALYAGTWGTSSTVPRFTLDTKGRITAVTNTAISLPPTTLVFGGDVYGSGIAGSTINLTISDVLTSPGTYGSSTRIPVLTVNSKGQVTGISDVAFTAGSGTVTSVGVSAGTGISASVANPTTTPVITITNTAPDQIVTLTGGTGISTSGTYPSFTITNTSPDQVVSLSTTGTGLSVTGTYPSFTLQNTLPDQTVALTAGTGISVTGTYPNFTITNTGSSITPAALTKVDDTNVTLTLGGTPATSLLQAVSLTLGWTGTLADSRIASASTWNAKQNAITLTTTGTSGAATFIANTLNIPQYQAAGTYVISVGATGPITSSGGTTPTISTSMATNRLIGRTTAGTGVMEEITVGTGLSLSGGTLSATAQVPGFEMNFLLMGA